MLIQIGGLLAEEIGQTIEETMRDRLMWIPIEGKTLVEIIKTTINNTNQEATTKSTHKTGREVRIDSRIMMIMFRDIK